MLPAVLVGRTTGWDTEIVVQNVSGEEIKVTFEVSPDSGGWFNNNVATLKSNERRIFLASQLLYAPASGTLTEKDGWAWMKVRGFHPTNGTPKNIAVTVNMFKQGLTDGKYRAEYGSERFMQFEAPMAGTELFVPGWTGATVSFG